MSRLIVSNIETQNIKFDSDTTAFTIGSDGVLSGTSAPGMVKLYGLTSSSSVASHDISSTYINSTYNNYYLSGYFEGDGDTKYLQCRVMVGGVVQTGSIYQNEVQAIGVQDDQDNNNTDSHIFTANNVGMGGEDGEGTTVSIFFQNANSTRAPFSCSGISSYYDNSGNQNGSSFSGGMLVANRANIVNGLSLKMHSSNITYASFTIYGIK
jgi:hypothetical protein